MVEAATCVHEENRILKAKVAALIKLSLSRTIAYQRSFATITGDVVSALLLSQIYYWADRGEKDADGWMDKSASELYDETAITEKQQRTARRKLVELGLLEEKHGSGNRLHFRLDVDHLKQMLHDKCDVLVEPEPEPQLNNDLLERAAALKAQEKRNWSKDRAVVKGRDLLYPWNIDNDPHAVDEGFAQWLVDKAPGWVPHSFEVGMTIDDVKTHCQRLINPTKRAKYERNVLDAWEEYKAEQEARAAKAARRRAKEERNRPENNPDYLAFRAALQKDPDFLIKEYLSPAGLKVSISFRGHPILINERWGSAVPLWLCKGIRIVLKQPKLSNEAICAKYGFGINQLVAA